MFVDGYQVNVTPVAGNGTAMHYLARGGTAKGAAFAALQKEPPRGQRQHLYEPYLLPPSCVGRVPRGALWRNS